MQGHTDKRSRMSVSRKCLRHLQTRGDCCRPGAEWSGQSAVSKLHSSQQEGHWDQAKVGQIPREGGACPTWLLSWL